MLTVVTSSLMYYVERAAQPDVFSSIPDAMWWSIVTVTTVGYGNATPVTVPGQVLGGLVALLGTGMGALPAGFLASGFSDALDGDSGGSKGEGQEENFAAVSGGEDLGRQSPAPSFKAQYCPHCGSELPVSIGGDGESEHPHRSNGQVTS